MVLKDIAIHAYRDYLISIGLTKILLPSFRIEDKLPFIPLESEIDCIISSVRLKMSVFLRVLKDCAVRPIEAWRLKWIDIDTGNRCLTITPAKYSNARKLKITEQTLNLLLALSKKNQYIFSINGKFETELDHFTRNYEKQRTRISAKLANPRLRLISFRTFRHWKATTLYRQTKDILYVMQFLGHRSIRNTLRYITLSNVISNNEDEYVCKIAKTVEESKALIESGFEYVTELDSVKLFRKRK